MEAYAWQVCTAPRKPSRYGWVQAMNVRQRWLRARDLNLPQVPASLTVSLFSREKFPVRICREIEARPAGFQAFARARLAIFEGRIRKIPCIFLGFREIGTCDGDGFARDCHHRQRTI